MRYVTNLSYTLMTPLEELLTREEPSLFGRVFNFLCFQTLAEKLWTPFRMICFNPLISLGVLIVIYLIFSIFFLPLWILSFIITSYGSFIIFLILFHYLIIYIIRLIAFPGSNQSTQKQLAQDFWKRILGFLENIAIHSNQYSSTMLLIANGQLPIQEIYTNMQELQKILMMIEYLPNMITYLQDSTDYCKAEKELNHFEIKLLNDFIQQLEQYYQSFHYLYHFLNEEFYHISSHSITTQQQHYHHQQKNQRLLLQHASKCLKSSETIRVLTQSLLPESNSGGGDSNINHGEDPESLNQNNLGVSQLLKLFCSFREKINSFEHITFPYMRAILVHRYGAKNYWIQGSNGNRIDGVYIYAAKALELQKQPPKKPSPTSSNSPVHNTNGNSASFTESSPKASFTASSSQGKGLSIQLPAGRDQNLPSQGLVLFCNPNAAYYETISQQEFDKSWLGYYINLGFDVFFYNYPGYGRSTGSPSPHTLQADGQAVIKFLKKEFPHLESKIIVHGESIGGLVACSIAADSNNRVSALVCDRTFASLDATASRLMGSWAGNFMKFGAFWNTNVVNNYLKATCPKIVLQDPADEIVHEASSLKAGISYKLCFDDDFYAIPKATTNYMISYYLKEELHNTNHAQEILDEISINSSSSLSLLRLTPRFILHFYYCFLKIAYLSTLDYNQTTNHATNFDGTSGSAAGLLSLNQIEMIQRKGGLSSSNNSGISPSSGVNSPARVNKRVGKTKILSNSAAELMKSSNETDNPDSNSKNENGNSAAATSSNSDKYISNSPTNNDESLNSLHPLLLSAMTSRKAKLEDYLTLKMTDSSFEGKPLLPFKKAFVALYRITNGSDYLLGHAMSKSLDTLQSWLCGYLVWNGLNVKANSELTTFPMTPAPGGRKTQQQDQPNSRSPKEVNKSYRKTVKDAIDDMHQLLDELYPESLGKNEELKFVRSALILLYDKQEAFHHPQQPTIKSGVFPSVSSAFTIASTTTSVRKAASKDNLSRIDGGASHVYQCDAEHDIESSVPLMKHSNEVIGSPRSVASYFSLVQCFSPTVRLPETQLKGLIGDLLPLHTGHNGWPRSYELKYMTEWLAKKHLIDQQD